jgi:hypothetical protein
MHRGRVMSGAIPLLVGVFVFLSACADGYGHDRYYYDRRGFWDGCCRGDGFFDHRFHRFGFVRHDGFGRHGFGGHGFYGHGGFGGHGFGGHGGGGGQMAAEAGMAAEATGKRLLGTSLSA